MRTTLAVLAAGLLCAIAAPFATAQEYFSIEKYANVGLASARNPAGVEVTATDPSHYLGRPRPIPMLGGGGMAVLCFLIGLAGAAILLRR